MPPAEPHTAFPIIARVPVRSCLFWPIPDGNH
jgi:hypothetical protein